MTLVLDAAVTGAVVLTTQPERLDWASCTCINDKLDDCLLVARMQMLQVNPRRKSERGKKLESVM